MMRPKPLRALRADEAGPLPAFTILLLLTFAASAAMPATPEPQGVVFRRSADDVEKAAANALVMTGFEIKKEDPLYVEGARPRTLGVLPGETVGVRLESLEPARTRVRIETTKSAVSIGQKNWDAAVLEEMEKTLGKRE
jgi:hypothetical protein